MQRDFDIFEKFPDGSTIWRTCVSGQFEADRKLAELAEHSQNEFVAIDIQAGDRFPANVGPLKSRPMSKKAANG
jgi:hypothetical protein